MTIQSSVKDKILATLSEMSKVENAPAEMLRDLDQQMEERADDGCTLWIKLYSKYEYEIRYHPCKANVVIDALRRKERVKPRRVRVMAMTIQYGVRGMILEAQSEVFKQENVLTGRLHGACVIDFGGSYQLSIRCAPFEALYGRKGRSRVIWAEIGGSSLIGPELVQETTNKVVLVKEKPKVAGDCQKSYANNRRKPLKFEFLFDELRGQVVNDVVTQLNVLTSFLEEGEVHVVGWFFSLGVVMLLFVPLCGQARLLAVRYRVKVCWNSKRGPEFTWEREDFMKSKYPQLFVDRADESTN
ncbi:hypothetical protein Tco_0655731 [Tanacetum coccineum]|uniref:Reverse transcriptase domain-containing protein n=1 Tax=Tanacetum coccineum TaxID=301880 RepID=A0ABQ4X6U2_9ASTR